ncbi:metal-binding protein [Amycolatopsis sp. NPDC051373]|uniref:metal-binding protein n=1 Tax=Amycolatopsis sp. NPDC051373 TaxID=3155801 RepID=UPI00344F7292
MIDEAKTCTLLGPDGPPYRPSVKGAWGGHRKAKIYGRLDCPCALRAIAGGGYVTDRVFFVDEAAAAGFRPRGTCCEDRHRKRKTARENGETWKL